MVISPQYILLGVEHLPSSGHLSLFMEVQPKDICFELKSYYYG